MCVWKITWGDIWRDFLEEKMDIVLTDSVCLVCASEASNETTVGGYSADWLPTGSAQMDAGRVAEQVCWFSIWSIVSFEWAAGCDRCSVREMMETRRRASMEVPLPL